VDGEKTKKPIWKKWWFWGIVIIVLIAWGSSGDKKDQETKQTNTQQPASQQQAKQAPPAEQVVTVSPEQIAKDYKANEVAADNKYKGKLVQVSGEVDKIGKDITDTMYVVIKGDSSNFTDVQCFFNKDKADQLAQLQKGQSLTIKGKCNGLMMNVLIKDCEIIK